jgi:hypothetical protein
MSFTKLAQPMLGKYVAVRSADSGLHVGVLAAVDGVTVRLTDTRRVWKWLAKNDGLSFTEMYISGPDEGESRLSETAEELLVGGVCEISPITGIAEVMFRNARPAKGSEE